MLQSGHYQILRNANVYSEPFSHCLQETTNYDLYDEVHCKHSHSVTQYIYEEQLYFK